MRGFSAQYTNNIQNSGLRAGVFLRLCGVFMRRRWCEKVLRMCENAERKCENAEREFDNAVQGRENAARGYDNAERGYDNAGTRRGSDLIDGIDEETEVEVGVDVLGQVLAFVADDGADELRLHGCHA